MGWLEYCSCLLIWSGSTAACLHCDLWLLSLPFQSLGSSCIFLAWFVHRSLGRVLSIRLLCLGVPHYFCHWRAHRLSCPGSLIHPSTLSQKSFAGKMEVLLSRNRKRMSEWAPYAREWCLRERNSLRLVGQAAFCGGGKARKWVTDTEQMICERGNMTLSAWRKSFLF